MNKKLLFAILVFSLLSPFLTPSQHAEAAPPTVKVAFCPSFAPSTSPTLIYNNLTGNWSLYGEYALQFTDVTAPVTYDKLVATGADVVLLSDPWYAQQYSRSEVDAIQQYLSLGNKGVLFTFLLNKGTTDDGLLAPLVGVKQSVLNSTDDPTSNLFNILQPSHPVFAKIDDPWNSNGYSTSQALNVSSWSEAIFPGAQVVAETDDNVGAVIAYENSLWRGVWATTMPDYGGNSQDNQFIYNSIVWLAHLQMSYVKTIRITFCPSYALSTSPSLIYNSLVANWSQYGKYKLQFIDVTAPVTYDKLVATKADVVIISDPWYNQYSASEADAIQQFLSFGNRGILLTFAVNLDGTDDSMLAPLVGAKRSVLNNTDILTSDTFNLIQPNHPIFANVDNPWNSGGYPYSQNLNVSSWPEAIFFPDAQIVAETNDSRAAVIVYDNLLWRGVWATTMPDFFGNEQDKQFIYNSIVWLAHQSDTTPPQITILEPSWTTYATATVPLTFTVNKPTSWIGYSIDGGANATITDNVTLPALSDGSHSVVVFASGLLGNTGRSETVYFMIDTLPPYITHISQNPPADNVQPTDQVDINATVTDSLTGVNQVTLNYTTGNGTWIPVTMGYLGSDVYHATIPAYPQGTHVTYVIIAADNVLNTITTQTIGYTFEYRVLSEFSPFIFLPLLLIMTLLAMTIYKVKKPK